MFLTYLMEKKKAMVIKSPFKLDNCCCFRLFDSTTLSFVGKQSFNYKQFHKLRKFANDYAEFTLHRVYIVCKDSYAVSCGKDEFFAVGVFEG